MNTMQWLLASVLALTLNLAQAAPSGTLYTANEQGHSLSQIDIRQVQAQCLADPNSTAVQSQDQRPIGGSLHPAAWRHESICRIEQAFQLGSGVHVGGDRRWQRRALIGKRRSAHMTSSQGKSVEPSQELIPRRPSGTEITSAA